MDEPSPCPPTRRCVFISAPFQGSPRSAPSSDAAADGPYSVSSLLLDWLVSSFFLHPPSSAALMLFLLLSGSALFVSDDIIHAILGTCRLEATNKPRGEASCQCGHVHCLSLVPRIWSCHRAFRLTEQGRAGKKSLTFNLDRRVDQHQLWRFQSSRGSVRLGS